MADFCEACPVSRMHSISGKRALNSEITSRPEVSPRRRSIKATSTGCSSTRASASTPDRASTGSKPLSSKISLMVMSNLSSSSTTRMRGLVLSILPLKGTLYFLSLLPTDKFLQKLLPQITRKTRFFWVSFVRYVSFGENRGYFTVCGASCARHAAAHPPGFAEDGGFRAAYTGG